LSITGKKEASKKGECKWFDERVIPYDLTWKVVDDDVKAIG
jgi:hypothetical protein